MTGPERPAKGRGKANAAQARAGGTARPAVSPAPPVGNRALTELVGAAQLGPDRGDAVQRLAAEPRQPDPFNPFDAFLREEVKQAARRPPPPAPVVPVVPGDTGQQAEVFRLRAWEVFDRPDISAAVSQLSDQLTAANPAWRRLKPGTWNTPKDMWRDEFEESLDYILTERTGRHRDPAHPKLSITMQAGFRRRLEIAEAALLAKFHGDELASQVEALRARFRQEWADTVDLAARRFVELAASEATLLAAPHRPKGAYVLGLPAGLEPTRTPADAPKQLEDDAAPVTESVVRFMTALQDESKDLAPAGNYQGHELANPHVAAPEVGHYSFDVGPKITVDPSTGFYQHAPVVAYFMAMERAAKKANVEWQAFYNDAAVITEVNDALGVGHVAFSGGGGHGQFHHGPAPFILHIHVNIMPKDLEARFRVGKNLANLIRTMEQQLTALGTLF